MASYGESRLTIEGRTAGSFRLLHVSAPEALGPRLAFHFDCVLGDVRASGTGPAISGYKLADLVGEVRLSENGPVVGSLFWLGRRPDIRSLDYVDGQQLVLTCELDPYRLERLEEVRAGRPLTLWIQLWPTFVHEGQPLHADLRGIRATIPRDEWITILNRLRPEWYELVELRADLAHAERFRTSLELVRRARDLVDAGHYDQAVAMCRKAVEQLAIGVRGEIEAESVQNALAPFVGEDRAATYAGFVSRVKQLGNLAVHEPGADIFSRQEALFVIRSTENALCLFGAVLGSRQKVPDEDGPSGSSR